MKVRTNFLIAFVFLLSGLGNEVLAVITSFPAPDMPIQRTYYEYTHIVPAVAYEHEDICLSVFVDQLMEGDEARVQFKTPPGTGFQMMALGYNHAEQRFVVCINERHHMNSTIEYYIELFPTGMAPIRIPEKPGEFNQVKVRKKISKYWEPILIVLLIAMPPFGAFLYSKIRKAHTKRKTEYENKLKARRRKLHKEREKHYQEYLKTLSGRKVTKSQPPVQKSTPPPSEPQRKPVSSKPVRPVEMDDTDKELRQELDNILNVIPTNDRSEAADERLGVDRKRRPVPPLKSPPRPRTSESDGLSDEDRRKLEDLFED